jgi:hypothetical protein
MSDIQKPVRELQFIHTHELYDLGYTCAIETLWKLYWGYSKKSHGCEIWVVG